MSGGSWDYMYRWETEQFLQRSSDVSLMAKRLLRSGHSDAAKAIEEFALILAYAKTQIETRSAALEPIMRAVEWVDSCDSSEEDLTKVVDKWRGVVNA